MSKPVPVGTRFAGHESLWKNQILIVNHSKGGEMMGPRIVFDFAAFGRRNLLIVTGAVLLLLAAIVGMILVLGGNDGGPDSAEAEATPIVDTPTPSPFPSPAGPPTDTPTPSPTPTLEPYEHLVQEGETLYYIIQLYGYRDLLVVPEVILLNDMVDENDVVAGDVLLIPRQTPTPGPTATLTPTGGPEGEGEQPQEIGCDCSPDNRCISPDGQYWIHSVQPGDTIAAIAFYYTARISSIKEANNLFGDDPIIYECQQIYVPIEVTLTPTLTPTGGPDSTATPTPTVSPPPLVAPLDGAAIPRADPVVLQWVSVYALRSGERYRVTVRNLGTDEEFQETTRTNTLRLPDSLRPDSNASIEYEWRVEIVDGTGAGATLISGVGESWRFTWGS
jgi:hypothetical protein